MTNQELEESITEQWESGALGQDMAHAKRASADMEALVDRATAMRLVSIRLPVALIDTLKAIAKYHGVGYQPMVRDLLGRFALSEYRTIVQDQQTRLQSMQPADNTQPVTDFMERERKRA